LIGVAVVVLVGLGWVLLAGRPKDLKLRLKFVRSEIVNGTNKFLFKIEGADQHEVCVAGFWYVANEKLSSSNGVFAFTNYSRPIWGRLFLVNAPQYSPNAKGLRLQADVGVFSPDKNNPGKALRVIKDAWDDSSRDRLSYFSTAKAYWQNKAMGLISEQTLTSDLITNTPPH
jgi:hypothetical protein